LLSTSARVVEQIDIEAKAIDHPQFISLLSKGKTRIVVSSKEHDVVALFHPIHLRRMP
jgi:hypothetical protein